MGGEGGRGEALEVGEALDVEGGGGGEQAGASGSVAVGRRVFTFNLPHTCLAGSRVVSGSLLSMRPCERLVCTQQEYGAREMPSGQRDTVDNPPGPGETSANWPRAATLFVRAPNCHAEMPCCSIPRAASHVLPAHEIDPLHKTRATETMTADTLYNLLF